MDRKLPTINVEVEDINRTRSTAIIRADKTYATQISKRLEPYKHLPRTFRPALEGVADYVRNEMITRTFDSEGPGWAPLRPRTVSERVYKGYGGEHPILVRTRDLFKELTQKSHPKHIEIIKTGKNARIEIGGSSHKFIENQMGNKAQRLPPRPMIPGTGNIPIDQRDRIAIKNIIAKAIRQKVR